MGGIGFQSKLAFLLELILRLIGSSLLRGGQRDLEVCQRYISALKNRSKCGKAFCGGLQPVQHDVAATGKRPVLQTQNEKCEESGHLGVIILFLARTRRDREALQEIEAS